MGARKHEASGELHRLTPASASRHFKVYCVSRASYLKDIRAQKAFDSRALLPCHLQLAER